MKTLSDRIHFLLLATLLLALPVSAKAQFSYSIDSGGYITIDGAAGTPVNVPIPSTISGHTVVAVLDHAFQNCSTLVSITLPATIQSIGSFAFAGCPKLTNISISGDPYFSSSGGVLFHGSQLIVYPGGLSGSYTIPDGTTSIGSYAFGYSSKPLNLIMPASLADINDEAFYANGGLTSITLPSGLSGLGIAFVQCSSLTNIGVDAANTNFSSINGVLFDKSGKQLIAYPPGLTGSYTIPNGVTNIAHDAFYQCQGLNKVTVPPSVTSLGDFAFGVCFVGLTNVFFQGNAPVGNTNIFSEDKLTFYYLPGTTGWDTFPTNEFHATLVPVLWNPQILSTDGNLGFQNNQFGFNVTGDNGLTVVVEGTTNFIDWQPVCTNGLNGGAVYFNDPQSTNFPGRLYRIASP